MFRLFNINGTYVSYPQTVIQKLTRMSIEFQEHNMYCPDAFEQAFKRYLSDFLDQRIPNYDVVPILYILREEGIRDMLFRLITRGDSDVQIKIIVQRTPNGESILARILMDKYFLPNLLSVHGSTYDILSKSNKHKVAFYLMTTFPESQTYGFEYFVKLGVNLKTVWWLKHLFSRDVSP